MDNPPHTWLQLPDSFAEELAADTPLGLWLQPDGYCNKSSLVAAEFTPSGYVYLTRGWKSFARARGLKEGYTLLFKFDGAATLFVKIFGEAGGRLECCMESDSSSSGHSSGDDSGDDGSDSHGRSGSDADSDEPPRRCVKTEEDRD
nr:B3 domain-containing protein Os03g0212300-like [Aegilops tauschii subsp. strangulata]